MRKINNLQKKKVFKKPLEGTKIIKKSQCSVLFSNIELILGLNTELLRQLENVKKLEIKPQFTNSQPKPSESESELPAQEKKMLIRFIVEREKTSKTITVTPQTTGRDAALLLLKRLAFNCEQRLFQLQSDYAYCTMVDQPSSPYFSSSPSPLPLSFLFLLKYTFAPPPILLLYYIFPSRALFHSLPSLFHSFRLSPFICFPFSSFFQMYEKLT